jgi:predicted Zn finger-like uncharacterized protein
MKIVCDSCATKYSISDDKVRGKVFKIRCKKCSHIIVVRGTTDASAAAPASAAADGGGWHLVVDGDQVGPLVESEIRARLARNEISGDTYIWKEGFADWLKLATVAEFSDVASAAAPVEMSGSVAGVGGDLFTDSAVVSARDASSQIQVEEGVGIGVAQAAMAHAPMSTPSHGGGGGGLFGAIDAAASGPVISSPRAARPLAASAGMGAMEQSDAFGAPPPRGGGDDLFSAHAAAQSPSADEGRRGAAHHDGGRVDNLTAQRHENSVLFSLANLQQLAMPGASAPRPLSAPSNGSSQSEGSGLIDIRAMAATTLGAGGAGDSRGMGGGGAFGDDLPAFGSFSSAAPVLLSMPSQSGPPKWIYAVIAGMAILVIGIGLMAYKILTTKPVTVVETVQAPAAPSAPIAALAPKAAPGVAPAAGSPVAAAGTTAPTTAPAIPDENLPPREGSEATTKAAADAAARHAAKREKAKGAGAGKDKKAGTEGGGKSGATVAAAAPEPVEKKAAKGSLDDLLENALSGKKSRPRPAASSDDDGPAITKKGSSSAASAEAAGPLSKSAVVAGMNSVKPKVAECYNQFKVTGMAMVNVSIAKSGKVSSATVSGKFAGTPTGTCVEKAVKSAGFPPSEGLNTPYPFTLK